MMKKILAAAIVSAFAAPAFAATANVDIYGRMALSVDYVDGGSNPTGFVSGIASNPGERRARVSSNTSIIGFKGAEDLGGGISAIWQIENQIAATETSGGTFLGARETFAGLSSKTLGSLTLGLRDTAHKLSTGKLDVFGGGNTMADYRSLFGGVSNGSVRAENSVTYISPNFGGFVVRGTSAAMQENGSSRNPHLYSLSGTYEAGPLFVTLAHEDMQFAGAGTAAVTCTALPCAAPVVVGTRAMMFGAGGNNIDTTPGGSAEAEQKNTRLGAGFTFGNFKLGAAIERTKVDVAAITGTVRKFGATATTASASTERDALYVSGAFKMGNTTLKAAFTKAGELDGLNNSGAKQFSFGVDNAMSKRTTVYALVTQVRNDRNAAYSLGGNPVSTGTFQSGGGTGVAAVSAAALGEDPRGISIGMIHSF